MKHLAHFTIVALSSALFIQAQAQTSTNKEPSKAQPPPAVPAMPAQAAPVASPAAPTAASTNATPHKETPSKTKFTPAQSLDQKGKIEKLDAAAGTFTVEGKNFTLSPKYGKVYVDNVRKELSDLKEGDLVAVTYFEKANDINLATRVIKGYRHHKKKKSSSDSSDSSSSSSSSSTTTTH